MLGPTGSGKSELAVALAESFNGEVVNCDSVQVYRGLNIGTAKMPLSERRGIPHHLTDVFDPRAELSAGAYARLARPVLREIAARRHVPILAGGTGFYLRALLDGLSPAPARDERLRARLGRIATRRPATLRRLLQAHDPRAAARIHPNDLQKLIRALELTYLEGQPASTTQSRPRDKLEGFTIFKLGLAPERKLLYARLNARSERMFREGLIEETAALLASGVPPHAKPLQSLGYKQAVSVLNGSCSLNDAIRECQTKTRQYAKRQLTWFRAEPDVIWFSGFGSDPGIQQQAIAAVAALAGPRPKGPVTEPLLPTSN